MLKSKRVWASLITNLNYLPGLLTLQNSLHETGTIYPFVAFHTPSFPAVGLQVLHARGIKTHLLPALLPVGTNKYDHDPRFRETWTKLLVFSVEEYDRIVLLDGDMLVRQNIDWLMADGTADGGIGIALDNKELGGRGKRVFAAAHACACNPLKKDHYPANWVPQNCAYTSQHPDPVRAQTQGAPPTAGVGMLNSGLLVVIPSKQTYAQIEHALRTPSRVRRYAFPDQELLSDVFYGRWVPLPYVYNALKTMRGERVHGAIWRDAEVRNVHYIFARKPWDEPLTQNSDELDRWWWEANARRMKRERELGIDDGF